MQTVLLVQNTLSAFLLMMKQNCPEKFQICKHHHFSKLIQLQKSWTASHGHPCV